MKREIRHFHVVIVQKRQGNVQKSVMHVQSCCFAYLTYCGFFYVLVAVASSDLKVPNKYRLPCEGFSVLPGRLGLND